MTELVMRCRWFALSMLVAAVVLAASPAFAQSASERAQRMFDDGWKQLDAGHVSEACTAFENSEKLEARTTTLLALAACREQNHQLATAWTLFGEAKAMASAAGDQKLTGVATNHVQLLEPRVSRLTIVVAPDRRVAGLEVLRNSEPVASTDWGRARPVDGGSYTITAKAPGRESWSTTRAIKVEGDSQTIEIPALTEIRVAPAEPKPLKPTAPTAPTDNGSAAPGTTRPDDSLSREGTISAQPSLVLPLAFGGGALALGGLAIGLEVSSEGIYDRAKAQNSESLRNSAITRRYAAQAVGAVAIASAGVAIYLYVRGRSGSSPPTTAVAPMVSPDLAGLAMVGRW